MEYVKKLTKCRNHPTEEIRYLCIDHDQLCCNECAIVNHRKCQELLSIDDCVDKSGRQAPVVENMEKIEKHAEDLKMHEFQHRVTTNESERLIEDQLHYIKIQFDDAYRIFEENVLKAVRTRCDRIKTSIDNQILLNEQFEADLKYSKEKIASSREFGEKLHHYLMERDMKDEMIRHEQELISLHQRSNCTEISMDGLDHITDHLIKCLQKNLSLGFNLVL
ncbi:uncharacterized protein LOC128559476 [Mercenaria mercenaria]|uniref:uncharacterized protein LOC128559476 n=1 Tax=Mercenaria mercenaria TaxID=6596 RepID=UPI00234ED50C|nr:uncharacterized protein LOC128559476 [Mercenaria mercenaria]